jgi:hypothetical protein
VSHTLTGTPPANAVAATVRAWFSRSGASTPQVTFTTSRVRGSDMVTGYDLAVHTFFLSLLVLTAITVTWFAGFVVYRLVKTPR